MGSTKLQLMGLFKKKYLNAQQVEKLHKILPTHLHREQWTEDDFKDYNSFFNQIDEIRESKIKNVTEEKARLEKLKIELANEIASNITIFNTEPFKAEPLGMVDVGQIKRFGATTTGDRFAGGAIGYAIESVIDDTWTKNNLQEKAVNEVKLDFLRKARSIFPNCTVVFKYEVDFREIGTSGNVFIYMRGTAATGKNSILSDLTEKKEKIIFEKEKQLKLIENEAKEWQELTEKIPQDPKQISQYLGE